ncbi:MAG TPA: gamma-glutamylcyclotransferase, partial [Ramlibacter sp.]|nr:gamma-glutamylcyclotransferase [Ramlibacter sp.]
MTSQLPKPLRDPAALLEQALREWGDKDDLWIFGYGSLIWRPDFEFAERRPARVHGWHRALKMWSRVNRGTPERPGLVFAMLSG